VHIYKYTRPRIWYHMISCYHSATIVYHIVVLISYVLISNWHLIDCHKELHIVILWCKQCVDCHNNLSQRVTHSCLVVQTVRTYVHVCWPLYQLVKDPSQRVTHSCLVVQTVCCLSQRVVTIVVVWWYVQVQLFKQCVGCHKEFHIVVVWWYVQTVCWVAQRVAHSNFVVQAVCWLSQRSVTNRITYFNNFYSCLANNIVQQYGC